MFVLPLALLGVLAAAGAALGAGAAPDTLVLVNGDPITTADLDRMVMQAHADFRAGKAEDTSVEVLLDRRIQDYLIMQDAVAAGYDQEESFLEMIDEKTREYAIGVYVRDNVNLPEAAPADSVRASFDRYYWRIQLRRISVRTADEARALRARVAAGEDMDALAREFSVDSKRLGGGLYNMLYWADVENRIRDAVRGLKAGDLSPVVPYNDAYTFLRVEKILPVHEEVYEKYRSEITAVVHGQLRQRVWDRFLADQVAKAGLAEDIGGLMAIIADSAQVLDGAFLKEQPGHVFELDLGDGVTGTELRRAIAHEAMQDATRPFGVHMKAARTRLSSELVLGALAAAAGYEENAEVQTLVDADWERELISRYLRDHVTAKITFKREEYEELYEKNREQMRGPDEVRLDVLILDERDQAEEAAARLKEGADFGFIFGQYHPEQEMSLGQANFIAVDQLSKSFREALETMEVGDSSDVIRMPMGWMVFHLDSRRPGPVPPIEEVEMDLRRALLKLNFDRLLAEHVAALKEGSEIVRFPERIEAYLQPAKEGS